MDRGWIGVKLKERGIGTSTIVVLIVILAIAGAGGYVLTSGEEEIPEEERGVSSPAEFEVSNLSVSPSEVKPGGTVELSINVSNIGDVPGTYTVELKVDDTTEDTKDVTLDGGKSTTVSFRIEREHEGTFNVSLAGLVGSFRVGEEILPANWDEAISIEELYENPSRYAATSYDEFEDWLTDPQQFVDKTVLVKGEIEMTGLGKDLSFPFLFEVRGDKSIGLGGHDFDMVEDGQNVVLMGLLRYDGESFGMKVEKVYYSLQETREFEIKSWEFDNYGDLELSCYSPIDGSVYLYSPSMEELDWNPIDSEDEVVEFRFREYTRGTYTVVLEQYGLIFYVKQITFSGANLEIVNCNLSWNPTDEFEVSGWVSATIRVRNNGDLPSRVRWIEVYDKEEDDPLFAYVGSKLLNETILPSQTEILEAESIGFVLSYDLPLQAEVYLLATSSPPSEFPQGENILASCSVTLSA